jgi:hypothetical protein
MHEGRARSKMRQLGRRADRVCRLILTSDYPDVDIAIARARLREACEELFPDRLHLFDLIYESRFDRLWDQFREPETKQARYGAGDNA